MTKTNSATDTNALTNFHPMPKRFMVWDKVDKKFLDDPSEACAITPLGALITRPDMVICQSTNLFDEDDEEIFEGSVVRDFDEAIGVVYYDREDGEYRAKSSDGDSFELADSSCDLKVVGHILSNPELVEEK